MSRKIASLAAIFKDWVDKQINIGVERHSQLEGSTDQDHTVPSISEIVAQQGAQPIINDVREYQQELFERAKVQNTIAVLDTGTGKTLIAILLIRHVVEQELEDRDAGKSHRIAFFLVPSVNLVFQQQAVLKANLDFPIARIHGGDESDLWTRDQWLKTFAEHKAIVCTAAVLQLCLGHGFIHMSQINLLVFDEAHHAKLNHPYAKIMTDHYSTASRVSSKSIPRVFGMTASPVDIKKSASHASAAKELEEILHSTIATTTHLAPLREAVHRPQESTLTYHQPTQLLQSPMTKKMLQAYGHVSFLEKLAIRADLITTHLGAWCADAFWTIALSDRLSKRSDAHIEGMLRRFGGAPSKASEAEIQQLREMISMVGDSPLPVPSMMTISPKVATLLSCLEDFFARPSENRCIVFVEQRDTAKLLAQLFCRFGPVHIKADYLVGESNQDFVTMGATLRRQVLSLRDFRKGVINCIFSTSVAEEGLDIADCNLIIRFDPCKTMIQYVQSRGRARHQSSRLIHLLEVGNLDHSNMLDNNKRAEVKMRSFCEVLPRDRLLDHEDDFHDFSNDESESFIIKETGAKLTSGIALTVLQRFTSSLQDSVDEPVKPVFATYRVGGGFISEVVLPAQSPCSGLTGDVKRRRKLAKFSAAFRTCVELRQRGLLDNNWLPTYQKRISILQKAALGLDSCDSSSYDMMGKPDWLKTSTNTLYPLLIEYSDGLNRPVRSLILVSRRDIGDLPPFRVYVAGGRSTLVQMTPLPPLGDVSDGKISQMTSFTLKIMKDLFNKTYEYDTSKIPFWLLPATQDGYDIDFDTIATVYQKNATSWEPGMDNEALIDRFLMHPRSGGKRYFTKKVVSDLRPNDCVPTRKGKDQVLTILEATVSEIKSRKQPSNWDPDQPVLEVEKVVFIRNPLAGPTAGELAQQSLCYICPEPLLISALPTDIATWFYTIPGTIGRVEAYMVALEACTRLGLDLRPDLALQAVTKDSSSGIDKVKGVDADDAHDLRDIGLNYERLEFIGDTFLKMATSIAAYAKNPMASEHEFHMICMLMLCNQNLYNVAVKHGLYQYIRSQSTTRRSWYPNTIQLQAGRGSKKSQTEPAKHRLSKKTLADVGEALIGAALVDANPHLTEWHPADFDKAVNAVTIMVESAQHDMRTWSDYQGAYVVPAWQTKKPSTAERALGDSFFSKHAYKFKNVRLLHAAFTHPQMPRLYERVASYQQLEFLGDSLLDMACVSYLFVTFPHADEGWLTEHKMLMVSNKFLSALCVKLDLPVHLRHADPQLGKQIMEYAVELEEAQQAASGAAGYWLSPKDYPKTLADVLEACIGAIFIDSGFDFGEVQRFFRMHVLPFFEDMDLYDTYANDHPVNKLNRRLDEFGCKTCRLMIHEIPSVEVDKRKVLAGLVVHNEVIGGDYSESARYAKSRCADKAAKHISGMSTAQFKLAFGCDCEDAHVPDSGVGVDDENDCDMSDDDE